MGKCSIKANATDPLKDIQSGFLVSIHHAIQANDLVKKQVAEESGLSRQHLYRVLNGESIPSFDKVVSLLATLGVQLDISPSD